MSEVDDLKKYLEELQATIAETTTALAPIENEKAGLQATEKAAYAEYQAKVAAARKRKMELDELSFEQQTKLNKAKREAEQKARELEAAIKQAEKEALRKQREEELAMLNQKWDRLTIAAGWREWAKDHQIAAGHKIVQDRKVILADPMGLGKTLSAIITNDMAEAATRLTNPDFPFLGEEKEVWVSAGWKHNTTGNRIATWEYNNLDEIEKDNYTHHDGCHENKIINAVERPVGKKILYICPSSLIRNVEREFRMWAGHRSVTFVGGMPKAAREFAFSILKEHPEFVVICNYEAWRKDLSLIDQFIGLDFDTIIIDEAHNIKDMKTSAYRGVKRFIDEAKPEYVIPMTGTPILNRPQELFSLLTLVNPEQFYHLNDFLFSYCEQDEGGFWKFQPGGIDRIAKRIGKNFLRRTRDQAGIVLPEKTIINHDLPVDTEAYPAQHRIREQMRKNAIIMIDEAQGKAIAASAMIAVFTRLRQVETWPAGIKVEEKAKVNGKWVVMNTTQVDVEESQKIDYVISPAPDNAGDYTGLIPEAISDERMVLFSQFKAPLYEIQKRVQRAGFRAVVMDGSTPQSLRDEIAMDFDRRTTPNRSNSKWDIVLCNYRVGGVGLNLTAATQMIILDEEWNPGKRDQAYDRLHRIGQEEAVTIHVVRTQKTIDDWLAGIMGMKEDLVEGFNTGMVDTDDFKKFLEGEDGSGLI